MELECYDLSWRYSGNSLWVEALVDDGEKRIERIPAPFDPYCYIETSDFVMDPLRVCNCRVSTKAPDGFTRIEADHPSSISDFDDRFAFQTYEADIHYNKRVAIDEDVDFARPDPEDILYFDIEVDDRGSFTDPEDADDRIIAIAGVGGDGEEMYFADDDEEALIEAFLEAADEYVALAGWNSVGYDFPYLKNRVASMGKAVEWRRWVLHDVMPLYDMLAVPTKTVSTKLDDTGLRELDEGKTGVKPGDGRLYELWWNDPERLREYNLRDADLVRRIDEKYGLVDLLHVICDICVYPPGEACYRTKHGQVRFAIGQVVDSKLLSVAHRKGIPQPNKRSYDKPDDFPGGYVLEPKPGMYEWVMAPDYGSMYPNIVRSWNFGRETWVDDDMLEGDDGTWRITGGEYEGHRAIKGETGGFVHPDDGERSVPAEAADELVEMREGAAEIVDKGVKSVNNCFSSDTDVMTPDRGPVNIKELEVGDEVYSINPDTLECEVKSVVDTTAEPNNYGELVHFQGEAVDLKVTPNHRMLSARYPHDPSDPDGFEIREARDMEASEWVFPGHEPVAGARPATISILDHFEGHVLVDHDVHGRTFRSRTGCPVGYDGNRGQYRIRTDRFLENRATISELGKAVGIQYAPGNSTIPFEFDTGDLLEFMGWYIAEGSSRAGNGVAHQVTIHQKDETGRETIRALIERLGFNYFEHEGGFTISNRNVFEWCRDQMGRKSDNKRIPDWVFELDHSLLERLHRALMEGDGCDDGRGSVKYTTISDTLRDDFARLMVHLGKKMRFRRDPQNTRQPDLKRAHRVHENYTTGITGHRNAEREDHDGMVYCVSVADNHTVMAGRNGIMQWTGQTLYGVFAADHQRYFGPHSENITLIGQELTGTVERIADRGHEYIRDVVYGDTDSLMIDMEVSDDIDTDDAIEAAKAVTRDIQDEMRSWASAKGAEPRYLTLDLDDVYDRFYIGDKKKRYFGNRIFDGAPCDNFKMRGFEARQNDWPEPVRRFQEDLMHAKLDDDGIADIISDARSMLFSGRWDHEMATSTKLGKPIEEYEYPQPHTRAARGVREHFGRGAARVGDKVDYIKYGNGRDDVAWVHDGQIGVNFRPNDGYCNECEDVVDPADHPHDTEHYPHFRESQYGYLWRKKFKSVMDSIDVSEQQQTALGAFL